MDKQRILREAQKIAAKFSFWMVSGNISHLYGYAYETPEKKYELEIKFDENFPNSPPQLIFHEEIKKILGDFQLQRLKVWTPDSAVVDIIHELKAKIQEALMEPVIIEETQLIPITPPIKAEVQKKPLTIKLPQTKAESSSSEEFITPDLSAYPEDLDEGAYNSPSESTKELYDSEQPSTDIKDNAKFDSFESAPSDAKYPAQEEEISESDQGNIAVNTELGLIQQYYAYDQKGSSRADLNIYMTITVSKTFIIEVNFSKFPEKPLISFPSEVKTILGDPNQSIEILKKWNVQKPAHIVDILQEIETKLYFIKDIEVEAKKILGEYRCDMVSSSPTQLKVHLLTYGFNEYLLDVDLAPFPKPPLITLTPELQKIIQVPIASLNSVKNWKVKEAEPVEIIREISWLVDKNSRINFEVELLREHYKDIKFDPSTTTIKMSMKGKMKTQDLTFDFQVVLPREYPMKTPEVKVLNEFDIETQEKSKKDLQTSFNEFFKGWTPFTYLIDFFNMISKKIFEVSMVSCVICHKIDCPTCSLKIAGVDEEPCHVDCPYCERSYHKHCWEQTIKSFGKCGFCLKTPPPSMM